MSGSQLSGKCDSHVTGAVKSRMRGTQMVWRERTLTGTLVFPFSWNGNHNPKQDQSPLLFKATEYCSLTFRVFIYVLMGFPDSSVGKESACNSGDLGSIPGSGRSTGKGIGYLFQYSWAFLVGQLAKYPPAMRETWAWSLCWEDPLEKGKSTLLSILAWRISCTL